MTKREKEIFDDLMDLYEFEVIQNENGTLSLNDLQGACLGDICDEIFKDEFEILERMEIYHEDYIIRILEDTFDTYFNTYREWLQFLIEQREKGIDEEIDVDIAVLSLIVNHRVDSF
jgi:DNA-binding ferritin-like protein (Dps family)